MVIRRSLVAVAWWSLAVPALIAGSPCDGVPTRSGAELRLRLVTASVPDPVDATAPPGDAARLFVVEQAGRIWIVDLVDDSVRSAPFLDIRSRIAAGGERGLLGLAFHPRYAENGRFFVYYTRAGDGASVVARYVVSSADPDRADAASERILLTINQPYSNHNGGQIAFGPLDGYLYIGTGDGGSGGDPGNRAQNPGELLGKILRIDVDGSAPYAIPASNPFVGVDGVRGEIWALGLRNPWRFAFDRETGDMIIADVGQGSWEEINFQSAIWPGGANYEWRVREGNHPYSATTQFGPGIRVPPAFEYAHAGSSLSGCSVTGGRAYRGCGMPDLHGTYFFADYCAGWIRSLAFDGGVVRDLRDRTAELNAGLATGSVASITSFGEDGRGELYVMSSADVVYRIVPAHDAPPAVRFKRGDVNGDGIVDIGDPIAMLLELFGGSGPGRACADAADANDDGTVHLADAVYLLAYLFGAGPAPADPFATCGVDQSDDGLACESFTPCVS